MDREGPLTPQRASHRVLTSMHDSPFSDYFTDDARSVDDKAAYNMPSAHTQSLLRRLNDVGAQILRREPAGNGFGELSDKLDALEDALGVPGAQTRRPARLADSGLFMQDDDEEEEHYDQEAAAKPVPYLPFSLDGAVDAALGTEGSFQMMKKNKEQDRLLKEVKTLLDRVTKANTELRGRFDDMRELNEHYVDQLEESAQEVLVLRSEKDALRADLAFDHSELLFLKLQMKALEVQADGTLHAANESTDDKQQRVLLDDDMHKWKSDWDDIDARLRGRRIRNHVTSVMAADTLGRREDGREANEEGDWKLDLSKKRKGRVQSITLRRTQSLALDGANDEDGDILTESTFAIGSAYSQQGTPTESSPAVIQSLSRKTPWQELCEGLTAMAGMTDR